MFALPAHPHPFWATSHYQPRPCWHTARSEGAHSAFVGVRLKSDTVGSPLGEADDLNHDTMPVRLVLHGSRKADRRKVSNAHATHYPDQTDLPAAPDRMCYCTCVSIGSGFDRATGGCTVLMHKCTHGVEDFALEFLRVGMKGMRTLMHWRCTMSHVPVFNNSSK